MFAISPLSIAMIQGAIGIMNYRILYGDAPKPRSPCRGVVVVNPENVHPDHVTKTTSEQVNDALLTALLQRQQKNRERPFRLLVIGDSLAIGVGQSMSSTPIMPGVIAKSLSKALGGRIVYWSCLGAPGASAAWIVKELEQRHKVRDGDKVDQRIAEPIDEPSTCSCCETDDSSSGGDSSDEECENSSNANCNVVQQETPSSKTVSSEALSSDLRKGADILKDKLKQQLNDLDSEIDIAVVLTGSNDLKNACFPFLLQGEAAELRRQAYNRGGDYAHELRRVLETLGQRMRLRFDQFVRESVEYVSELPTETVDKNSEPAEDKDNLQQPTSPLQGDQDMMKESDFSQPLLSEYVASSITNTDRRDSETFSKGHSRSPLVVLPGMAARVLPAFDRYPLKWLSVPMVDMMDTHKENLAKSHPGQVLFSRAPTTEDVKGYEQHTSELWKQNYREQTLFECNDTPKSEHRRILQAMKDFYLSKKDFSVASSGIFSVDKVHPTDIGYDFWGRLIAESIIEAWSETNNSR